MFEEPDVLIETDRLLLRDVTEQDTQLVYQLYSLPESSRYEYWSPVDVAKTKRIVSKWIREQYQKPRPAFHIMVLLKATKAMVGICGLEIGFNPDEAGKIGNVGYRYFPDEWSKGYATEALCGVVEFAFSHLGLHKIESGCVKENRASSRVLEKSGFQLEGCRRQGFLIGNQWHDFMIYGILKKDKGYYC